MSLTSKPSPVLWSVVILTVTIRVMTAQTPPQGPASGAMRMPPNPQGSSPSGIAYFRELLSAKPDEREKLLGDKPPEVRAFLLKNVGRYEALSPEDRELRLRTMELRYHVTSLLRAPATNRVQRLASVPENLRPLVEDRLKYWDTLSSAEQKYVLQNELAERIFIGGINSTARPPKPPANPPHPSQVVQIEKQLVRWQSMPEPRRELAQNSFNKIFEFSDEEKAKAQLQSLPLSAEERELMEKAIVDFRKLPVSARLMCIRNFPKFANLSAGERQQFLSNAQEWQKMSAADRETWRKLVGKVPRLPPLPPGLGLPPKPKLATRSDPATALDTTNR